MSERENVSLRQCDQKGRSFIENLSIYINYNLQKA